MTILKYKDYEATAEIDMDRLICRGKILFINDVVTFEANSPAEIQREFELAVDDYLETSRFLGRDPKRPLKGQFNVRVPPALHKALALRSIEDKVSLNEVVVRALDAFVCSSTEHHVRVSFESGGSELTEITASASQETQWKVLNAHH